MIFTCITNKKSGEAASISAFPAWRRGTASAVLRCFRMQHKCTSLSPILSSLFHTMSALSLPPYRHPERSPRSLLHCRHRHTCALTQTTPWCFLFCLSLTQGLPVCKKDPSTSALMTRTKDGLSHIVFHTAAWIHPAPLARPFSKGLLVSLL